VVQLKLVFGKPFFNTSVKQPILAKRGFLSETDLKTQQNRPTCALPASPCDVGNGIYARHALLCGAHSIFDGIEATLLLENGAQNEWKYQHI
jgi:hypothetical protein